MAAADSTTVADCWILLSLARAQWTVLLLMKSTGPNVTRVNSPVESTYVPRRYCFARSTAHLYAYPAVRRRGVATCCRRRAGGPGFLLCTHP